MNLTGKQTKQGRIMLVAATCQACSSVHGCGQAKANAVAGTGARDRRLGVHVHLCAQEVYHAARGSSHRPCAASTPPPTFVKIDTTNEGRVDVVLLVTQLEDSLVGDADAAQGLLLLVGAERYQR